MTRDLGRDVERRSARPASVADQPAGDGYDEELLAVDDCLEREAALDGMDDVSHPLDEERPARIPVRAIGLEASDLIERGRDIGRDPIWVDFMRHSPLGSLGLGSRTEGRAPPASVHGRPRSDVRDHIGRIACRGGMCPGWCGEGRLLNLLSHACPAIRGFHE